MSDVHIGPSMLAAISGGTPDRDSRLRGTVKQLEGLFVEQLFKAMRETVPDGGVVSGGAGEEMFTGMMDQQLAVAAPEQWQSQFGEALYQQLRGRLGDPVPVVTNVTEGMNRE